jgi:predicted acyltransferase
MTMFLLIAEGTRLFSAMSSPELEGTIIGFIGTQLHHHPWHGYRFWDLIQPFFMFIVGVALPFSVKNRIAKGDTRSEILKHVLVRSFMLLLFGWGLYCIGPGRITFRFQNVLAQLSVTYLIAYLIMNRKFWTQFAVSILILAATDLLYRFFQAEGFNQPYTPDMNFGAWVDMKIAGEMSGGHWVSFNAIPTTAHTIWGVLVGQWLLTDKTNRQKLRVLVFAGVAAVIAGYALDLWIPIIKRIATVSFVVVTGGWCVLALTFSYWLIDIKKFTKGILFFSIVGMNSLFIYLFTELGGGRFMFRIAKPFVGAIFGWTGELYAQMLTGVAAWLMLWYLCYWLYKRKIWIKL